MLKENHRLQLLCQIKKHINITHYIPIFPRRCGQRCEIFYHHTHTHTHTHRKNVCKVHIKFVHKPKKCLASSQNCLLSIHFTHLWVAAYLCVVVVDGCFFSIECRFYFSTVPFIYGFYINVHTCKLCVCGV